MTQFWQFALLGLGVGGIYALAAQGIVLVYQGSGVVNFANGAMAAVGAFVYVACHDAGFGTVLAIVVGVLSAGIFGVLVHVLVMRPLRSAFPLTRLVATLGILTAFQAALLGWPFEFGTTERFISDFLPSGPVEISHGISVAANRLWLLAIACTLTGMLWAIYRFTRFGLITRAVTENEGAAAALGHSPDLIGAVNWGLGGALAGLAGILVVPIIGLSVNQVLLLLIPALAAALVGGFTSFPLTLVGGLFLGVTEAVLSSGATWIPDFLHEPGWSESVPFLVIVAVLVVRGRALPVRGHLAERLPRVGSGHIRPGLLIAVAAGGFLALNGISGFGYGGAQLNWVGAVTTTAIAATICLSLVVVTGFAGQLSLAQYALAGVGAYVAARADSGGQLIGLFSFGKVGFPFAVVLGVVCTVPIGLLVGLPALRTRGVNLAIATLGLSLVIQQVVLANPHYTGGYQGTVVRPPHLLGFSLDPISHPRAYATLCLGAFAAAGIAVANIRRGRSGRRLLAVRTNERAAASLGISVTGAKLYGFGLGAAIAGLGGVLLAFRTRTTLFSPFNVFNSIQAVVQTVLGGVGLVGGALFGGAISSGGAIAYGSQQLLGIDDLGILLISSALLVVSLMTYPDGVAAQLASVVTRLDALVRQIVRRSPIPTEALPEIAREPVRPRSLEVKDLRVTFGGVVALDDVSLEVHPGEIVGLIGPNGAGKTTLIDVVTGFTEARSGHVTLDGSVVDGWSACRRARAGITRSFQSVELFEDMTVDENVRTASDNRAALAFITDLVWPQNPPLHGAAVAAIQEFGLAEYRDAKPSELPFGTRRLVGIARALATQPSVLLLDEPGAGLDRHESAEFGNLVRQLATTWGLAILLVDHDVNLVMSTCDRIVALDFGRVIGEGAPSEIRENKDVIASYLGASEDTLASAEVKAREESGSTATAESLGG